VFSNIGKWGIAMSYVKAVQYLAYIAITVFRVDCKLTRALHAKTYNMAKLQKPES
jgi:hypothetical protein